MLFGLEGACFKQQPNIILAINCDNIRFYLTNIHQMKKPLTIFASIAIIVIISSCQSTSSDSKIDYSSTPTPTTETIKEKTAEEIKAELAQKESENPSKYLILKYNLRYIKIYLM